MKYKFHTIEKKKYKNDSAVRKIASIIKPSNNNL